MLELLISVLVAAVVVWLIFFVLGQIPMPPVLRVVISAVVALVILLWLLRRAGVFA